MFEVKDKPGIVENALLIGVQYPDNSRNEIRRLLDELGELVKNLRISVQRREIVRTRIPKPQFLLGSGKTMEIINLAKDSGCDCIVFDETLSPGQQRNWERESGLQVMDRHEVILDIFAERAQTKESVLQVELARMEYALPRLKRAWTHLNRQRGGRVTQRGEGEAQIEIDQRLVRNRITRLKRELRQVVKHRSLQRKKRLKVPLPTAAIVGYTNAGKSSLLNCLTRSRVLVEDKLFATLDPTTRRLRLPSGQCLLLTDTVGFVRRLPPLLVDAFKATLEEAVVADFLIHVLDGTSPEVDEHRKTTLLVLKELGAREKKIITVYNKIDLLGQEIPYELGKPEMDPVVFFSALTAEGEESLLKAMEAMLEEEVQQLELIIPHNRYDLINRFHRLGRIKEEEALEEGVYIRGDLPQRRSAPFLPFALLNGSPWNFEKRFQIDSPARE